MYCVTLQNGTTVRVQKSADTLQLNCEVPLNNEPTFGELDLIRQDYNKELELIRQENSRLHSYLYQTCISSPRLDIFVNSEGRIREADDLHGIHNAILGYLCRGDMIHLNFFFSEDELILECIYSDKKAPLRVPIRMDADDPTVLETLWKHPSSFPTLSFPSFSLFADSNNLTIPPSFLETFKKSYLVSVCLYGFATCELGSFLSELQSRNVPVSSFPDVNTPVYLNRALSPYSAFGSYSPSPFS